MEKIKYLCGRLLDITIGIMFMASVVGALFILPFACGFIIAVSLIEFVVRVFIKQMYEFSTGKDMSYKPWFIQKLGE